MDKFEEIFKQKYGVDTKVFEVNKPALLKIYKDMFQAGFDHASNILNSPVETVIPDINYEWNLHHSMDDFKKLQEERDKLKKNLNYAVENIKGLLNDEDQESEYGARNVARYFLDQIGVE